MAPTLTLPDRRTLTLDTGRRSVEVPVDELGRERWRARMDAQEVELRDDTDDATASFRGHAAVFNKRTWIGPKRWGFWEQVGAKAFDKTIGEADVRFLVNHNPDLIMARSRGGEGTLSLSKDSTGLVTEAASLDRRQSYTNDIVIALDRRDVSHMSFAFEVVRDSWEVLDDDTELRTLDEVRLWDVSVVTYPAYTDTDAGLRGAAFDVLCRSIGFTDEQRADLLRKIADGEDLPEPGSSTRDDSQPGSSTGVPLALLKRRHAALGKRYRLTA